MSAANTITKRNEANVKKYSYNNSHQLALKQILIHEKKRYPCESLQRRCCNQYIMLRTNPAICPLVLCGNTISESLAFNRGRGFCWGGGDFDGGDAF